MTIHDCWARIIRGRWLSLLLVAAAAAAQPRDLASLVQAYRAAPSPVKRAAVVAWAPSHPKDASLVKLALGVAAYEQGDYAAAIEALKPLSARLPQIADYV